MKKVNLKKFKLIGTMVDDQGETKVRWVNNESNLIQYKSKGYTDGVFQFCNPPLNKLEAVLLLIDHEEFQTPAQQKVLTEWLDKHQADYEAAMETIDDTEEVEEQYESNPEFVIIGDHDTAEVEMA